MDDFYWEEEKLNKDAVYKLIERHRDEYDELAGENIRAEIEELRHLISMYESKIEKLEAMNPQGVNVPALTETVAILGAELDRRKSVKVQ